jgi:hypothetical protein
LHDYFDLVANVLDILGTKDISEEVLGVLAVVVDLVGLDAGIEERELIYIFSLFLVDLEFS